jgi:hypothetical protein
VNTLKHRRLIDLQYSANLMGSRNHGIRFREFSYKGHTFQRKWATELIETDAQVVKDGILRIGCAANAVVL